MAVEFGGYKAISQGLYGDGSRIYFGSSKNKICRFCGESEKAAFKNTAHAIPEFLGNHQLILNSECDQCNTYFSRELELHLDRYTRPFRTVAGITNKKRKTPKHKEKKASIQMEKGHDNLRMQINGDDFVELDDENNRLAFDMKREKFKPLLVYKALCKIAVSTVQSDRLAEMFRPTLQWLNRNDPVELDMPFLILEALYPGYRFSSCFSSLYFRNEGRFPHAVYVIGVGHHSLQVAVPTVYDFDERCSTQGEIEAFPDIRSPEVARKYGAPTLTIYDAKSMELVESSYKVHIAYESREIIPPSSNT